jgi:alpha-L-fucosidase
VKRILVTLALLITLVSGSVRAAEPATEKMQWFREAKFGMFMHWGIYAVPAGAWEGKTNHGEWFQLETKMPCAQYDKFAEQFNPVKFNATEWAATAKAAGMKYVVITSKHHDGFCMFDTKLSDFNIVKASLYARDPMKELAEAVRAAGLKFCFYYSLADWHHPESPAKYSQRGFHGQPKADADSEKYVEYMKGQIRELLTNYGPVSILWFDGGGAFKGPDRTKVLHSQEIVDLIHELQPACIVNDRLGIGDYGTPEQHIPGGMAAKPFEVCMTMNGHWGYNKADQNWKSADSLIRNLVDIVSKGGNYLLNVGPTAEGLIPGPSVERLQQVGAWLKINGAAIYGAGPTPFGAELGKVTKKDERGRSKEVTGARPWRCTTQPGKLYFHLLEWPSGTFVVDGVKSQVTGAYLLADANRAPLKFTQTDDKLSVTLPEKSLGEFIPVLCVEIATK